MLRCPRTPAPVALAVGGLGALTSGCLEVTTDADVTVFGWERWVVAIAFLMPVALAVGAAACAWRATRGSSKAWIGALALGLLALPAALVALYVASDRLVVTADEVFDHKGFPWAREKRGFRLEGLERLTFFERTVRSGRSTTRERYWVLHRVDGSEEPIRTGDLWEHAKPMLVELLEARGVRVGIDPRTLDLPTDDPFIVTVAGQELALDAPTAKERLSALLWGAAFDALRLDGGTRELRAAIEGGEDLAGRWSHTVLDGPRRRELALTLDGRGRFRYEVTGGAQVAPVEGEYERGEASFVLRHEGSTHELVHRR